MLQIIIIARLKVVVAEVAVLVILIVVGILDVVRLKGHTLAGHLTAEQAATQQLIILPAEEAEVLAVMVVISLAVIIVVLLKLDQAELEEIFHHTLE